jgi:carboxypeptidase family protein/TonB-dependent receptor-like protein
VPFDIPTSRWSLRQVRIFSVALGSSNSMTLPQQSLRRSLLAAALACAFATPAFAQSNASGVIFGRAAAGDTVRVENLDTGLVREISTDSEGRYRAPSLPVGRYRVDLKRDGSTAQSRDNVSVNLGAGTDVSFVAAATSLGGVNVTANALPPIDVSSTDSRTVITSEQLRKLPLARNTTAAALLAPGTVQSDSRYGNVASFGGASAAENQYYINGFSVTNALTGIGSIGLPFNAIDQQQIYTGGYGAEYGRSTGGVVDIVTQRGGNTWKGGAQVFWSPRALRDSPRSVYRGGKLYQDRSRNKGWSYEYAAYVGGPLVKDKLFFYSAADITKDASRSAGSVGTGTLNLSEGQATRWLTKLDWNITDSNILEFTAIGDNAEDKVGVYSYDVGTGTEGEYRGERYLKNNATAGSAPGGNVYIARYTSYLTDDLTLNLLAGRSRSNHVDSTTSPSGMDCPIVSDSRPGTATDPVTGCSVVGGSLGAPGAYDKTRSWRADLQYTIGAHSLRAGVDNQFLDSFSGSRYEGNNSWSYQGAPTKPDAIENLLSAYPDLQIPTDGSDMVFRRRFITEARARTNQEAQYIEDRWQVSDKWLVYLGLRNEQFKNFNGDGQVYVKQRHQLAPRLGATWDVFGDASFKVYANAGRYHLAVPSNVAIRGASASTYEKQWYTFTGTDPITGVPTGLTPVSSLYYANGADGVTPDPKQVAARNLKAYYQDEFILGFDKQLGTDWAFGARATYRNLRSSIDDFCDRRPFDKYAQANGVDFSNANIDRCFIFNPGQANTFRIDMTGKGDYQDITLSKKDLGFPKLKRRYYALDTYLEHRFNNQWYGKLQYIFSRSYGNSEGLLKSDIGQLDPSVTQDWDSPEITNGANGPLPNDRTHVVKAYGYFQPSPRWLFSSNFSVASGRPKNCFGIGPNDVIGYGPAYFYCDGKPSPRGSRGRLPWTWNLDLSAQYMPDFAKNKLAFTADIFNVFTQQRTLSVYEYGETDSGDRNINYLRPLSFQTPRYVRLGVRYDFSL